MKVGTYFVPMEPHLHELRRETVAGGLKNENQNMVVDSFLCYRQQRVVVNGAQVLSLVVFFVH